MDIDVRPVDPDDGPALATRHAVAAAAFAHDIPDFPPVCPVRYTGQLRIPGKSYSRRSWLGYLDGEPAGVLDLQLPLRDNLGNGNVEVFVAPGYRRRGVGRVLYSIAVDAARQDGRVRLTSETVSARPAGAAFARAVGATEAQVEVRRRLDLSTVDLDAMPAPVTPGYSVVYWHDMAPDEVLADLARLDRSLQTDAPHGDLVFEVPEADGARVRDEMEAHVARGEHAYHAAIRHDGTGAIVAWTILGFEPTVPDHAWQFLTVVDPAHRGHRLGLAVKLANLRYALEHEPALRAIDTWNARENRHMIAINEALGFRPAGEWSMWQHEF